MEIFPNVPVPYMSVCSHLLYSKKTFMLCRYFLMMWFKKYMIHDNSNLSASINSNIDYFGSD